MDLLAELQGSGEGRSYENYVTALRQQRALKDEVHISEYNLRVLEQVATYTLTTAPSTASLPAFTQVTSEIARKKEQLKQLVSKLRDVEQTFNTHLHDSARGNFQIRQCADSRVSQRRGPFR